MLARNETIFKWALYAGATTLFFLIQGSVLQRITLWGVLPFLYPILVAVLATYELPIPSTVFALAVGVVCDLLLPGSMPCFYTLTFPPVALCAALISQGLLPAGFFCSLIVTAVAFLWTGGFHCLVLWGTGKAAWSAGFSVMIRELCVSAPLSIPVTLLFQTIFRKTHLDA